MWSESTREKGRKRALEVLQEKRQKRIEEYNINPKRCEYCNDILPYEKIETSGKSTRFCSKTCSAKFNNSGRTHTEKTKEKISTSTKKKVNTPEVREKLRLNHAGGIPKGTKRGPHTKEFKEKVSKTLKEKTGGYFSRGLASYDSYAYKLIEQEDAPTRHPDDPNILQVVCYFCKKTITPKLDDVVHRAQAIKGKEPGEAHLYCPGESCRNACSVYGKPYNWVPPKDNDEETDDVPEWLRQECFKRDEYKCQHVGCSYIDATETGKGLYLHHLEPRKCSPMEIVDKSNLTSRCEEHHLNSAHQRDGCTFGQLATYEFEKKGVLE